MKETATTPKSNTNMALVAVTVLAIVILAVTLLYVTRPIQNAGRIKAIGIDIFSDKNCTKTLATIDWGLMSPGEIKGVMMYLKNTKNTNVTLSMNTTAWVPATAQQYFTASWNYTTGYVLNPTKVLALMLQLQVKTTITGIDTFSFTINVNATEKT